MTGPLDGLLGLVEAIQLAEKSGSRDCLDQTAKAYHWASTQAPALIAEVRRLREAVRDLSMMVKFHNSTDGSLLKHAATIASVQEKPDA